MSERTLNQFDPNSAALSDGIFGLPFTREQAKLVYLPVPWEATTSYGAGTSKGPEAILNASYQVDLFDFEVSKPYEAGLYMLPASKKIAAWNKQGKTAAQKIIKAGGQIGKNKQLQKALDLVNELSEKVNAEVKAAALKEMKAGKILALVGGDHASPYGAIAAMAEQEKSFGILHLDAHSDTRKAYEGFTWSHASIMYNVMENLPQVKKLVQVGIRDFCEEEWDYVHSQPGRIETIFDQQIAHRKAGGENWLAIAKQIVAMLPQKVWISFDIDGLDPRYCPHTGTPVPGGLDYHEAVILIGEVARSGRTIVGFDLNEVAPGPKGDEWDANVGARMLYKMTAWTLMSHKLRPTN